MRVYEERIVAPPPPRQLARSQTTVAHRRHLAAPWPRKGQQDHNNSVLVKIQEVAEAFADKHDLRRYEWLIGGYTLGIAMPPDWVGRHRPRPREDIPPPLLEPGLVMNFENQYDVFGENWSSAPGAGLIDTLLVGETALEIITPLPRELVQVG